VRGTAVRLLAADGEATTGELRTDLLRRFFRVSKGHRHQLRKHPGRQPTRSLVNGHRAWRESLGHFKQVARRPGSNASKKDTYKTTNEMSIASAGINRPWIGQ
jgi:hypothetical protein